MPEDSHQLSGPEETPKPTVLFETAIIASMAVAVLALFLFAWLGSEVLAGDTQHFDQVVRAWIHHFASTGMTRAMHAISLMGYEILLVEVRDCVHRLCQTSLEARRSVARHCHDRLRAARSCAEIRLPSRSSCGVLWLTGQVLQFSQWACVVLTLFLWRDRRAFSARIKSLALRILIWVAAAALVVAIGLSRIYLGVHYPSDVLAGYLAATVWVGTVIVLDHVRKVRKGRQRAT